MRRHYRKLQIPPLDSLRLDRVKHKTNLEQWQRLKSIKGDCWSDDNERALSNAMLAVQLVDVLIASVERMNHLKGEKLETNTHGKIED